MIKFIEENQTTNGTTTIQTKKAITEHSKNSPSTSTKGRKRKIP